MTNIFATWWWIFSTKPVWKNFSTRSKIFYDEKYFSTWRRKLHEKEYFCYIVKKFYYIIKNIFLRNEKHSFLHYEKYLFTLWKKFYRDNGKYFYRQYENYFSTRSKMFFYTKYKIFSTWWNMIKNYFLHDEKYFCFMIKIFFNMMKDFCSNAKYIFYIMKTMYPHHEKYLL